MLRQRVTVTAAGSNAHGQLANETLDDSHVFQTCLFAPHDDDPSVHQVVEDHGIHQDVSMASGANHTLLLLGCRTKDSESYRELWGCGDGRQGQLGPGYSGGGPGPHGSSVFRRIDRGILEASFLDGDKYVIQSVAASWEATYLVLRPRHEEIREGRDIILSLGCNDYGDLGIGIEPSDSQKSRVPHRVDLGEVFNTTSVDTISGFHITNIMAGPHHVVATARLFLDGGDMDVVVGWGACRHGQLGNELQPVTPTKRNSSFISKPRLIFLNRLGFDGNPDPVVSLALGNHHTALLHRSGCVSGFGSNRKGQLAGLPGDLGVHGIYCTWNGTYLVLRHDEGQPGTKAPSWEIRATGSNDNGQLGTSTPFSGPRTVHFPFDDTTHRLIDFACGSEHVLVLFARVAENSAVEVEKSEIWGWGWNEHGNLGLEHTGDVHTPTLVWPQREEDRIVLGIWAGCGTSWIIEARRS